MRMEGENMVGPTQIKNDFEIHEETKSIHSRRANAPAISRIEGEGRKWRSSRRGNAPAKNGCYPSSPPPTPHLTGARRPSIRQRLHPEASLPPPPKMEAINNYVSSFCGDIDEMNWVDSQNFNPIEEQLLPTDDGITSMRPNNKRSKNFSDTEDKFLVEAWLHTSLDAATGNEQSRDSYWSRIHHYFHENKQCASVRNQNSLANRWATIQEQVNKFCGCYERILNRNQSGTTAKDKVADALALYHAEDTKGRHFGLIHC